MMKNAYVLLMKPTRKYYISDLIIDEMANKNW